MKFYSTITLLCFLLSNLLANESFLSDEKQETLLQQQKINESEHEKLRYNWITPINLNGSYNYDKSATGDYHSQTETLSASIAQDIFRFGGITYQINYADAKKLGNALLLDQRIASLNSQLFTTLLSYKKTSLQLSQSNARLANKEIEIFIKRQLYDAGKVDITELNNALMEKSGEEKNHALLNYTLADYRYEISKISDVNPDSFPLPTFEMIEKEEYLHSQWDIKTAYAQRDVLENLYGVTKTNYLPKLTINANGGYRDYNPQEFSGEYRGNFYSGGISMSIPLTYNASATIQEAKATSMEQIAQINDKRRELSASYAQMIEKIKSYNTYIQIVLKNITLYDDLIAATQAGVNVGTKTGYDLKILKNSQSIEKLELDINRINIQIELAKLHFSLHKEPK